MCCCTCRYLITIAAGKTLQLQLLYRPAKAGSLAVEIPFALQQQLPGQQQVPGATSSTAPATAPATPHAAPSARASDGQVALAGDAWTGASVALACEALQPLLGLSDPCLDFGQVFALRANQFKTTYQRNIAVTNLDGQQQQVRGVCF